MRLNIDYTHRSHRYGWESSKDDKKFEFELEVKSTDTIKKIEDLIRTRYSWAEPNSVFIEGVFVPYFWYTLETFYINDGDTITVVADPDVEPEINWFKYIKTSKAVHFLVKYFS